MSIPVSDPAVGKDGGEQEARPSRVPWWRLPFAADTWRRTLYVVVALPLGVACVPLAVLGGSPLAASLQRSLVRRLLALRIAEPRHRRTDERVVAHAALSVPLGVVSFLLTAYLWLLVPMNLAFPLRAREPGELADSWGGPTLAGAWAVHAAGGLVFLFLTPWIVKAATSLQGRLARALLGAADDRGRA